MKITREGEYQISITDEGSILVRYEHELPVVMLRKLCRVSNCYVITSNFDNGRRRRVTKNEGIRLAKERLLAWRISQRKDR